MKFPFINTMTFPSDLHLFFFCLKNEYLINNNNKYLIFYLIFVLQIIFKFLPHRFSSKSELWDSEWLIYSISVKFLKTCPIFFFWNFKTLLETVRIKVRRKGCSACLVMRKSRSMSPVSLRLTLIWWTSFSSHFLLHWVLFIHFLA